MPRAPATPCRQQGCPKLVPVPGYCDAHRSAQYAVYNRARTARESPDDAFYHTQRWRRLRDQHMREEPLCRSCRARGMTVAGQVVDHITPVKQGGDRWDPANLQTLCNPCHEVKSANEGSRGGTQHGSAYPEWLEPVSCDLRLITGPPAAGKSMYVAAHRTAGDQVIDLAEILQELTGKAYHAGTEWLDKALRERNRRLGRLKRAAGDQVVWYVTTAPGDRLLWWQHKLKPKRSVVIDTPLATCIERIEQDPLRPVDVKPLHIAAAKNWWRMARAHSLA